MVLVVIAGDSLSVCVLKLIVAVLEPCFFYIYVFKLMDASNDVRVKERQ